MIDPVVLQIAKRLRLITHEVDRYSKYLKENYKITIPQLVCPREIHDHGPISLGAQSKIVYVNSSTVTGIIDRLEKRDLVRRTRVSKDRRQIHVEITEEGPQFIADAPAPLEERFARRLKKLNKDEIKALLFAIKRGSLRISVTTPPVRAEVSKHEWHCSPFDTSGGTDVDH